MSLITRTYTFTDGTTAYGSQVDSEVANIVNTLNNLDAGTTSWDIVKAVNSSSVPLIADNSTGSNDVADFKVNGTTKVSVDGTGNLQLVTATATTNVTGLIARLPQYRHPALQYNSGTVVNVESGLTGTSGQVCITFPDGQVRTDSTTTRVQCNLAQVAALTSTAQSGLRTGTVTNNTSYSLYAVKSQVNSTDIVIVADTTGPVQAGFATLNSNFGTNSWVYLGQVFNGDNSAAATGVVKFVQNGGITTFTNQATGNLFNGNGIRMATTAGALLLTYTYAAGTGAAQIPSHLGIGIWTAGCNAGSATSIIRGQAGGQFAWVVGTSVLVSRFVSAASLGVEIVNGSSVVMDVFLSGFVDGVLSGCANPLL